MGLCWSVSCNWCYYIGLGSFLLFWGVWLWIYEENKSNLQIKTCSFRIFLQFTGNLHQPGICICMHQNWPNYVIKFVWHPFIKWACNFDHCFSLNIKINSIILLSKWGFSSTQGLEEGNYIDWNIKVLPYLQFSVRKSLLAFCQNVISVSSNFANFVGNLCIVIK